MIPEITVSRRGVVASPMRISEGWADVVLDGAAVGVERCRRASPIGDLVFKAPFPEIDEVTDLVHRGQFASCAGSGTVLKLLSGGALSGRFGLAVRAHKPDVTVGIAVFGLRLVLGGLALAVGLGNPCRDLAPGADREGWFGHLRPLTCSIVGNSTVEHAKSRRSGQRRQSM